MKIKWGALVTDGRNKIGGQVASKNRYGAYMRTKVTPVNPATAYQVNARQRFATLSAAWRGLAAAQIIAWNNAVGDYARTDIFGDLRNPTGFNLYQRLNNSLVNVGVTALSSPPLPGSVTNFTSLSVAAASGAGTLTITFAAAIAATEKILVFGTPAISPGISFVKSEFRQYDVLTSADTSPLSSETEYETKFGSIGAAGQKIFIKLVPVLVATGQQGLPIMASAIIAA